MFAKSKKNRIHLQINYIMELEDFSNLFQLIIDPCRDSPIRKLGMSTALALQVCIYYNSDMF